jgi:hypothetical protein
LRHRHSEKEKAFEHLPPSAMLPDRSGILPPISTVIPRGPQARLEPDEHFITTTRRQINSRLNSIHGQSKPKFAVLRIFNIRL